MVLVVAALGSLRAQTVDPRGVYRVFLTDGRALPSYGEPTSIASRIAFVLVIGDPRAKPELQLISLPASAVDVRRTERYSDFLRAQQYAVTGGPTDYSAFTAEMTVTLADIEQQPDPRRRLDLALEARRRIAGWPAAHHFYRVGDVRTMLRGLDTIIADLARSAGGVSPPSLVIPEPPRYEPEVPLPGARDWVELSLAAAAATGDSDTRATILRNALSVAGTGEAASQIRAELARVTGQPAPAAPTTVLPPPPAVKASPAPAKPAPLTPGPPKAAPEPKASPAVVAAPPKASVERVPPKATPPPPVTKPPVVVPEKPAPAPPVKQEPIVASVPPVAAAPVSPAPVVAPEVKTPLPAESSNLGPALTITIGVVVLAAAAVAFRLLRRPAFAPATGEPETLAPVTSPVTDVEPSSVMATAVESQRLELVTVREAEQHGYHAVEGEVKNVSNHVLENLEVAVRWHVAHGAVLATDAALVDAGSLPAGRTVPFRVLTRSSPGMVSYSLLFKSKGDVVAQFQNPGRP